MNEHARNYIQLMSSLGYGHPMIDPDTKVRLGDVGFFNPDHTWTTLWNAFDEEDSVEYKNAFRNKPPPRFRPWDRSEPRFRSVTSALPKVFTVQCAAKSDADLDFASDFPPAETTREIEFIFNKRCGAVLILPNSATRSSFSEMSIPNITRDLRRDHPAWLKYARSAFELSELNHADLALISGVVKTSHWALACYEQDPPHDKLVKFTVGQPAGYWGSWQHSANDSDAILFSSSGPQQETDIEHVEESVITEDGRHGEKEVLVTENQDRRGQGEGSQKQKYRLKERDANQCVFVNKCVLSSTQTWGRLAWRGPDIPFGDYGFNGWLAGWIRKSEMSGTR